MKTISLSPILKGNLTRILLISLLTTTSLILSAQSAPSGTLIITFTDIRSDIGEIVTGIYSAEDQWIYKPEYSKKWSKEDRIVQNAKEITKYLERSCTHPNS